jgi:hypothetical protein
MKTKNIIIGLGLAITAAVIYMVIIKKPKSNDGTKSFQDNSNTASNDLKIEELKKMIIQLENQLTSSEMKSKWGEDSYVALQQQQFRLIKELDKLGWKTISKQGNKFQTEFIKK